MHRLLRGKSLLILVIVLTLSSCIPVDATEAEDAGSRLVISEIAPYDEGIAISNVGSDPADLLGCVLTDGEGIRHFMSSVPVGPGDMVYLAKSPGSSWITSREPCIGFDSEVFDRKGSLVLANSGDEVFLLRGGKVLDVVCYGSSDGAEGWEGEPVPCPSGCYIRRSSDILSGDWIHLKPGWTGMEGGDRFDAYAEPFSFPESGGEPVYRALSQAVSSVDISAYLMTCPNVYALLCDLERRGVEVRVLAECSPLGADVSRELSLLRSLEDAGGEVRLINPPGTDDRRYQFVHAKYAVVDDDTVVVTSENWTSGNMGYGSGNRGWGVVVESTGYAGYMGEVFESDFSTSWGDVRPLRSVYPGIRPYGLPLMYEAPDTGPGDSFSCVVSPVLSPDTSFKAMEGFMRDAGTRLYAEEMDIGSSLSGAEGDTPVSWMADAARRGVDCRLVLDSTVADREEDALLISASAGIKAVAREGGTDFSMIHNKGVISDDSVWVGSVNWTSTSFDRNRECAIIVESSVVSGFFADLFMEDFGTDIRDVEERGLDLTVSVIETDSGYKVVMRTDAPTGYDLEWFPGDGRARVTSGDVVVFDAPPEGDYTASVSVIGSEAEGTATYSVPAGEGSDSIRMYIAAAVIVLVGSFAAVLRRRGTSRRREEGPWWRRSKYLPRAQL